MRKEASDGLGHDRRCSDSPSAAVELLFPLELDVIVKCDWYLGERL